MSPSHSIPAALHEAFLALFGAPESGATLLWATAPGRVNLIGEHTDYHGGFVFPAALNLTTTLIAKERADRRMRVRSLNLDEGFEYDLDALTLGSQSGWRRYAVAPVWALIEEGFVPKTGLDVLISGDVPFGGGLSSSASIEVAWIKLLSVANNWELAPKRMAEIGKLAENRFVGVPCGIMDQFASAACADGSALLLDCRSLETEQVPIPEDWKLVILDTGVRHELAAGEYAKRQEECREGVAAVKRLRPDVELLRDVTPELLEAARPGMSELAYTRCRYVLDENARVHAFARALKTADVQAAGALMAASHEGLSRDYAVSCRELDRAVELARRLPGLIGARMTGGGFGGSTVNLVRAEAAEAFRLELDTQYKAYSGGRGGARLLAPGGGAKGGRLS